MTLENVKSITVNGAFFWEHCKINGEFLTWNINVWVHF